MKSMLWKKVAAVLTSCAVIVGTCVPVFAADAQNQYSNLTSSVSYAEHQHNLVIMKMLKQSKVYPQILAAQKAAKISPNYVHSGPPLVNIIPVKIASEKNGGLDNIEFISGYDTSYQHGGRMHIWVLEQGYADIHSRHVSYYDDDHLFGGTCAILDDELVDEDGDGIYDGSLVECQAYGNMQDNHSGTFTYSAMSRIAPYNEQSCTLNVL